jgi:predicted phosphodiesterase
MNNFKCPRCNGNVFTHGKAGSGKVRYECKDCGFKTTTPLDKEAINSTIKKHLIVSDTHAPYQNKRAVAAMCEFSLEYKPDCIIHIGDVGDFKSISHWMKNKRLELQGLNIQDDLDAACSLLKEIASTAPEAEKMVLLGNHDHWVYDYVNEHPELSKTINVASSYHAVGWKTTPWNELYRIGKLYTTHGLFINKYHANSTVHSLSASCLYGHSHDHQVFPESFLDGEKMAMSIGCLCDMNPEYLKNRPKKWMNGFATVDVLPNGQFFPDFIKIIDGRFSKMGKIYGG